MKKLSLILLLLSLISCTGIAGDSYIAPKVLTAVGDEVCFLRETSFLFWTFTDKDGIICKNPKESEPTYSKLNYYVGVNLQYSVNKGDVEDDSWNYYAPVKKDADFSGMLYSANIGFKYNITQKYFTAGEILIHFNSIKNEVDSYYQYSYHPVEKVKDEFIFEPLYTFNIIGGINLTDKFFIFESLGWQYTKIKFADHIDTHITIPFTSMIGFGFGYNTNNNVELKFSYTYNNYDLTYSAHSYDFYYKQHNFTFTANYLF
ncbi:MAG: hypothetical protein Ta2D_12970 [Rickettsiales bacterium]|nr:MAG: hypothetical protein Ta2D_12970 [Rickettsiales bacterium]